MSRSTSTPVRTGATLRAWAPYLVALAALLFAVLAWAYVQRSAQANDLLRAENEAQQVIDAITDRLNGQIGLLRACAGFFAGSDEVTSDDFRQMIGRLELPRYYPGTLGIGFSLRVEPGGQADLVQRMRTDGDMPDFQIWPETSDINGANADGQPDVHSIVYLEPLNEQNQLAIGYNMMSEAVRREAMERARDTGDAAASGRVRLVQEGDTLADDARAPAGFLIYVPVYRGAVPASVDGRREQLLGFVYTPIRSGELLADMVHDGPDRLLDLTVYDGEQRQPLSLMHDSRSMANAGSAINSQSPASTYASANDHESEPSLRLTRTMSIAGRPWTIDFATRPVFDATSERRLALYILLAGVLISALLLAVSLSQRRAAREAERIAEQMRVSQASLRESEQRFRATFNQAAAGMAQIDVDGRFLSVNQRLCDITGYADDELLGMNVLDITHPDDCSAEQAHMRGMLEGRIDMYSMQKRYVRRDGHAVWVNLSRSAVRDADGRMRYCIGVIEDITERRLAEQELQRHRDQLESLVVERTAELEDSHQRLRQTERLAALGTLSTGLGHDMGNLLLPIRLRLAAMQSRGLPTEFNDDIDAIRKSSEYLQQLANGLRLLALDPEDDRASAQATDLASWWSDAQPLLRNALPRGVQLECDLDGLTADDSELSRPTQPSASNPRSFARPSPPRGVLLARHLLTQVVFNLVQNAGDALRIAGMAERGRVRVWIEHSPRPETLTLGVSDNGPGMNEEVRRRCLEPFFTTKTRGIATGMGLTLVHGIVQRARGTIDLVSERGSGTTFRITLPVAPMVIGPRTPRAAGDAGEGAAAAAAGLAGAGVGVAAESGNGVGGSPAAHPSAASVAVVPRAQAVVTLQDQRRAAYLVSVLRGLGFDARAADTPPPGAIGLWVLEAAAPADTDVPPEVAPAALQYVEHHPGHRALVFAPIEPSPAPERSRAAIAPAPARIVVLSSAAKPTAIWHAARELARELSMQPV